MPDRDAAPGTSTGPNPAGERDADSPMPSGAVVGEAGIGDALAPDGGDPGGEGDLGRDEAAGARGSDELEGGALGDDAAIGTPEEEARRGRPSVAPD